MTDTIDRLRAIAAARTAPGQWAVDSADPEAIDIPTIVPYSTRFRWDNKVYSDDPRADAAFIVTADRTYEALLAVAEAARSLGEHHYESGRLDAIGEPSDPLCGYCGEDWPCPHSLLAAALDALEEPR